VEAVINIEFDDLLKVVKNLTANQLSILKAEIEKDSKSSSARKDFETLLLNGPTFSKEQLNNIENTRTAINQWRTK